MLILILALPFGLSAASLASPFAPQLSRGLSGLSGGGSPGAGGHHAYGALSQMSAHPSAHLSLHSANFLNSSCGPSSVLLISNLNEQVSDKPGYV